ncbi:MAG: GNAT family N-acetyltransferase [Lachnospiraceae bacterium]|nr:GNAT family N-acetyltransferase [Lachnospiraceae bacterium]
MHKLYEKKEILFAVLWTVAYCVILGTIRGNFGDGSIAMLAALLVFTAGILAFVKANHLEEKYGLAGWSKNMKKCLFFIPMWILATGNIWDGFSPSYQGAALVCAVLSMILVGFVEEMIFRGFLFRAMLAKDKPIVAIIVSSLTFGIGHIVNLFTGQAGFETVMQIIFAVSWGFILTMVCYKSGSILPCIIAHSMIDALSLFGADNDLLDRIYIGATIAVGIAYCIWLGRIRSDSEQHIKKNVFLPGRPNVEQYHAHENEDVPFHNGSHQETVERRKRMITLRRPVKEHESQAAAFKQEFLDHGETTINGSELLDQMASYDEWLKSVSDNASSETVNPSWVVTDTYFAFDENDRLVGIIDLRHELNDFLKDFGNSGYSVRPTERRKGHATEMLKLILERARQIGMDKLQLSVERSNEASVKTILKNGGKLERSFTFEGKEADVYMIRF